MLGEKLIFQGHNTFLCRHGWLKKGYDFIEAGGGFNDADAVVKLGVGKNMVDAVRYWLRAFGLTNESDELLAVAQQLLGAEGFDPYLEDNATLWYLHYLLVKTGRASIYHFVFNELRKEGFSFSRAQLEQFITRRNLELGKTALNTTTLDADLTVFIRSYAPSGEKGKGDIEEESSGLLQDLSLLTITKNDGLRYHIENLERREIPWQVVLRIILENEQFGETISFNDLEVAPDSPGLLFAMNEKGLFYKIEEMREHFPTAIIYSSTAGNRVLTIKKELINLDEVMQKYYGNLV
ncbi:DUF4007 family protein [Hymenobacter terrenus]|uniref:DUF4007 family protein n=1 Tax=Hymenobacter terrenus TaxID=1629124 RepID=UPI0006191D07|nr:DUF4007 family protein [Hymenobacter terrenus]